MLSTRFPLVQRLGLTLACLSLLSACEDATPPPPPPIVALPALDPHATHTEYQALVQMHSESKSTLDRSSRKNGGTLTFDLSLDLKPQTDGQLWLQGQITRVQIQESAGPLAFTLDTREPEVTMQDTAELEYELVHPGLASPDHPYNKTLQIFRALTEQRFQVRLNPDGSFAQLDNYLDLARLQPSLEKLKPKERADQEQGLLGTLNVLAPQDLELLLCLMLPGREQPLQDNAAQWQQACGVNGEKQTLEFTAKVHDLHSTPRVVYGSSGLRKSDNGYYSFSYSGTLRSWLEQADFNIARNTTSIVNNPRAGKLHFSNTLMTQVSVQRLEPEQQNLAEQR